MAIAEKREDPRVKRTRKLLQEAFLELFQEKDFASISIADIAERATVNRATFYAHFPDKYALLDSLIRQQFQQSVTERLPSAPNWDTSSLRALIRATLDFLSEFHHDCNPADAQFHPLLERAVQQELALVLETWLQQAPRSSSQPPPVPGETVASVMSWAIFGTGVDWSRNDRTLPADQMAERVLLVLSQGGAHLDPPLVTD
jgi:AcrR family transcriptional regulator